MRNRNLVRRRLLCMSLGVVLLLGSAGVVWAEGSSEYENVNEENIIAEEEYISGGNYSENELYGVSENSIAEGTSYINSNEYANEESENIEERAEVSRDYRWERSLFDYPSTMYNKNLALLAADLSDKIEWKLESGNFTPEIEKLHEAFGMKSDSCDFSHAYDSDAAFSFGYDQYSGVLVITARGTNGFFEMLGDYFKGGDENFLDENVCKNSFDFEEKIWDSLLSFVSERPYISKNRNLKILVTGHSLGGSAANLVGARLTKECSEDTEWLKHVEQEDVYVYTFGTIQTLWDASEHDNISDGYENIHNLYNYYDTFGPHGSMSLSNVSTINGKFGHTELYTGNHVNDSFFGTENHNMSNYIEVLNGIDLNSNHKYGLTLDCELVSAKEIVVKCDNPTIKVGGKTRISGTIDTKRNSIKRNSVNWSTSNPDVATVDDYGNVEGIKAGVATITVSIDNTVYSDSIDITVEAPVSTPKPSKPSTTPNVDVQAGSFKNISLKNNKTYFCDIDRDKKRDKIRIVWSGGLDTQGGNNSSDYLSVRIYVNGKNIFNKSIEGLFMECTLVDINKNDKYKEIIVWSSRMNGISSYCCAVRYVKGKAKIFSTDSYGSDKSSIIYSKDRSVSSGVRHGQFASIGNNYYDWSASKKYINKPVLRLDTPYRNGCLGYHFVYATLGIQNNKLILKTEKSYKMDGSVRTINRNGKMTNLYKLTTGSYLYKSCSKKSSRVRIGKGTTFKVLRIKYANIKGWNSGDYITNSDAFVKVHTTSGKVGWIYFSKSSPTLDWQPGWG